MGLETIYNRARSETLQPESHPMLCVCYFPPLSFIPFPWDTFREVGSIRAHPSGREDGGLRALPQEEVLGDYEMIYSIWMEGKNKNPARVLAAGIQDRACSCRYSLKVPLQTYLVSY